MFEVDLSAPQHDWSGRSALSRRPAAALSWATRSLRVDMAGRRLRAFVTSVSGHKLQIDEPIDDRFRFGQICVLTGAANGERRTILDAGGHFAVVAQRAGRRC